MNELLIKKIEPIGGDPESASVTLGNGENEIVVFCHPCWYEVGQLVPNLLNALDAKTTKTNRASQNLKNGWPCLEKSSGSAAQLRNFSDA